MQLFHMIRIVLSSFFGVRKRASHEADFANVNMVMLPFVAVAMALLIGVGIFGVVHLVVNSVGTMQGF
ncbi:DUF2970 domain-containing protein [Paraburkholderia sp. LEh10]|uniref:DUF2970 domain-containing protein n=1 Tax=Paraburkholderia sp. LEh10 TaxID=2821353 RepID=UPI001AEB0ED4|nr:DUF2970 domain-containing protein [Paraburkholderia sp. LEh10]MBP0590784.1 DUF2970 domain-containing protein [Paraburkholderia sp. LEh10]